MSQIFCTGAYTELSINDPQYFLGPCNIMYSEFGALVVSEVIVKNISAQPIGVTLSPWYAMNLAPTAQVGSNYIQPPQAGMFTVIVEDGAVSSGTILEIFTFFVGVASALDYVDAASTMLDDGIANGDVTFHENQLVARLRNAIRHIDAGRTQQAANQLQSFIDEVNSQLANNQINQIIGANLVDLANKTLILL